MDTVTLFGIPVRNIGFDDALNLILECVRGGGSSTIFFLNAHNVNVAHRDAEYRGILRSSTHVFPDGIGVRLAGILCGRQLRPDLNPTDLYPRLCGQILGVSVLELPGFEADDVIATLADRARRAGFPVVVVATDKDLLQLVQDGVRIYHPAQRPEPGAGGS